MGDEYKLESQIENRISSSDTVYQIKSVTVNCKKILSPQQMPEREKTSKVVQMTGNYIFISE